MTAQISNQNIYSTLQVDEDVQSQTSIAETQEEVPTTVSVPASILKRQDAKGSLALTVEASAVESEEDENETLFNLGDFPALGSQAPARQQQSDFPVETEVEKVVHSRAPLPKKFIVASSRIAELRGQHGGERQHERPRYERPERVEFNPADVAKALMCTKACQFVVRKEDGKFGVCHREKCDFSHCLGRKGGPHTESKLRLPQCGFGDRCNKRDGTYDPKTRKTDKSRKCQFFHPDETMDGFYARTGRAMPDLPETEEHTRKPKKARQSKKEMKAEQVKAIEEIAEAMGEVKIAPAKVVAPAKASQAVVAPAKEPEKETIIRVPKDMAGMAMEAALARGLTNFKIVVE